MVCSASLPPKNTAKNFAFIVQVVLLQMEKGFAQRKLGFYTQNASSGVLGGGHTKKFYHYFIYLDKIVLAKDETREKLKNLNSVIIFSISKNPGESDFTIYHFKSRQHFKWLGSVPGKCP